MWGLIEIDVKDESCAPDLSTIHWIRNSGGQDLRFVEDVKDDNIIFVYVEFESLWKIEV